MTSIQARVQISDEVLFHDLDGEAVLLDLHSGKYFGLDPVGTRLWHLLAQDSSLATAYQTLLDEYDVEAGRLQEDLLALVDRLASNGLIRLEGRTQAHEG